MRAYGAASSGVTSGVGLAIAKTIASSFIRASASAGMTRAPGEADEQVHAVDHVGRACPASCSGFVVSANQRLIGGIEPSW